MATRRIRLPVRWRSLRTQLVVWNAVTLALMMAVLGLFVQYTVRTRLMASVDRDLSERFRRILPPRPGPPPRGGMAFPGERPFALQPWPPRPEGPEGFAPNGLPETAPRYRARVLDAQGRLLLPADASGPFDRRAFTLALRHRDVFTTVRVEGERLRILSRAVPRDGPVERVIQVPYPLADVDRAMAGLNGTLLMLIPVAILAAGFAGALLTDRALRPVRRIAHTAGSIGAQDLSARLPVSGEDEFSDLSATFNAMLARLETSFSEQNRLVEALRQMIEQQRRFTADASHELRTPLTVIKANTSLALSGAPSPEESRQSMEDIDRAADAASRLVRDLLLLARSDAGQLGRDTVQLPVREVLSQAIANVKCNGGPPVEIDAGAGLTVPGNEDELVRVFSNLLENSIRYTPAEGRIFVTASSDEGWVRIRIADTGAGIAPEHLPHLGERFYRVDPARTRRGGGTGLGLSICRSIVEAHGGTMSFESQVGKGTTVTVSLPVTPGIPGTSAAPSA